MLADPQKTFYLEIFRLPDERPRLGKGRRDAAVRGIPARSRPSKKPGSSSTTPVPSAIKPSRKSFTAWPTTRSFRNRASALASSAAWRSRRAKRFSSARRMFRWSADRRRTASCRRCWCSSRQGSSASPDSTTARPTSALRPSSPPAPIRTADTSPSSKAATSSAPTAWCPSPAVKSAAALSDSVLAEARQMADLGYTEIQLLGQNVNSYKDPAGKKIFRRTC